MSAFDDKIERLKSLSMTTWGREAGRDDLRELIARVSIRQRCCSDCHPTHVDYDLADDLIRELGMREEYYVSDGYAFIDPPDDGHTQFKRYVSEWKALDEPG